MPTHIDSGRKDTGRTDKYSDETPKKDYQDYRADNPASKDARKKAEDITKKLAEPQHLGVKSVEVRQQELISHIQNYRETFDNQSKKQWKNKMEILSAALERNN